MKAAIVEWANGLSEQPVISLLGDSDEENLEIESQLHFWNRAKDKEKEDKNYEK